MNRPEDINTPREGAENEEYRTEAEWHSVSYRNGSEIRVQDAPQPRRSRRVALFAAILCCSLLLAVLAGLGGAMLAEHLNGIDGDALGELPSGGIVNNDAAGSGLTAGETPYPNTDGSYDYAAALAEITKNSNAALIGSPNGSAGESKKSMIEVTAAVKDSVVEIATTTVSNRGQIVAGAGSGVIIHEDGLIVTNTHVIDGSDQIIVRLTNGDTYSAVLRGKDEEGDIAILKITPQADKPLTVAKLGYSKALALGEEVIAIGNPLGELGGTVTNGIISALERQISVDNVTMTLLQTNAAINSGNSGGGLFNMAGELIGIVNAKYAASGVEGLGFAIPIDTAFERSFKDLLNYGYIRGIPTLGVALMDHTFGNFFTSIYYSAYVYETNGNDQFVVGDYIYSIDGTMLYGTATSAVSAVNKLIREHRVGDELTVVVKRSGKEVTLKVTLAEYVPKQTQLEITE